MSIAAERAILNRSVFYVQGGITALTTLALMEAYANGQNIHIYDIGRQTWINGHIQGIRNESGSAAGKTPKLLLLTVTSAHGNECYELFVRTVS